jgi:hypothetical protein
MQKQKFRIIVDPTNAIFEGDIRNSNTQMPKPGVDHHRTPAVYYVKALLRHLVYIWHLRQWHLDRNLLLYKDDINAAFRQILYHPDIAPTFATVFQHMFCIPIGPIFGTGFSPSFLCNTPINRNSKLYAGSRRKHDRRQGEIQARKRYGQANAMKGNHTFRVRLEQRTRSHKVLLRMRIKLFRCVHT